MVMDDLATNKHKQQFNSLKTIITAFYIEVYALATKQYYHNQLTRLINVIESKLILLSSAGKLSL
jgi:hypothetical protein